MSLTVVIDRFENGLAVLTILNDTYQFHLPLRHLPAGVSEGEHMTLTLTCNTESTQSTLRQVQQLQSELTASAEPAPDTLKL